MISKPIKRHAANIGKSVVYLHGPRSGRATKITGYRGDYAAGIPNVTLADGNSVPAHVLAYVTEKPEHCTGEDTGEVVTGVT